MTKIRDADILAYLFQRWRRHGRGGFPLPDGREGDLLRQGRAKGWVHIGVDLTSTGLVDYAQISPQGLRALEPYVARVPERGADVRTPA